MLNYYFCNYHF